MIKQKHFRVIYFKKYRPFYKKFIKLRTNILFTDKILNFKKQKWKNLLRFVKKNKKYNYKLFDHFKYALPRFLQLFKFNFKNKLITKKRFVLFYGGLKNKHIKNSINKIKQAKNYYKLLETFESRLDTVLYRAFFTSSIRSARQFIYNNNVYVNKKLVNLSSIKLTNGDLVEIKLKKHNFVINSIKNKTFQPLPPNYLQINYRTLQIIFLNNFNKTNFYSIYPFWIDVNQLFESYKY